MIVLRRPEVKDLDWMYSELEAFSKYYKTKKSLLGEKEYLKNLIINIAENHFVILAEDDKRGPMGWLGAILLPHLYNPEIKTMTIIFLWVAEKYRNSKAGYMLLKEVIRVGKQKADWVIFSINVVTPIRESTLKKLGFISHEKTYLLEGGV